MTNYVFDTYNDMAEYMIGCDDRNLLVSALAYIDDATELIRYFMMNDIDIGCIEIAQDYVDGYSDEYLISVVDSKLFVEKAFNVEKQEYIKSDSDILLICDDCGYDIDDCGVYAHFKVEEDCFCCDDCDECHMHSDECCGCDEDECEHAELPTYRIIDDDGNVIGTANITIDIEIED